MPFDPFTLGQRKLDTLADKQADTRRNIEALIGRDLPQLHRAYGYLTGLIYQNKYGLSAEQVAAAFASDEWKQLNDLLSLYKSFLNACKPGKVVDDLPEAKIELPKV